MTQLQSEISDQQLLRNYLSAATEAARDAAFADLVERHKDWIYSVCLRRTGSGSLAEDATQAVLLALARKAAALARLPSIAGWLYRAARFAAADARKRERRRHQHEFEAAQMNKVLDAVEKADRWSEIAPRLEPALDRLPEKYRLPILLRYYQQKSHAQIAAVLGISEPAAEKRVARALERLHSQLVVSPGLKGAGGASLSASAMGGLLLSHAVGPAPATVAASLTTASVAATSAHVAPLLKGILFMTTKVKALAVAAAVLLVAIPATVVVVHYGSASAPAPIAEAERAAPAEPLPADGEQLFNRYYALKPGQILAFINVPYEIRAAVYADSVPQGRAANPNVPSAMILSWKDADPAANPAADGSIASPRKSQHYWFWGGTWENGGPGGYSVKGLAEVLLELEPYEMQLDPGLADRVIPGDLVIREGATKEQVRAALEQILSEQMGVPVACTFRDATVDMYVLHGAWRFTPPSPAADANKPQVQLYETDDSDATRRQWGTVPAGGLARVLGQYLSEPVAVDATNLPPMIGYSEHGSQGNTPDAAMALDHLAEQTGLTWKKEPRTIQRLFVEVKGGAEGKLP